MNLIANKKEVVTEDFRITEFLDFVHHPVFYKLENTAFRKLDMFLSLGEVGGIHLLTQ
jgi:hypothetical protein